MESSKDFTNNDIYFMEVVSDKIIINDNYDGVLILDSELNIIKRIKLLDDLMIYLSFIKENEIILYCYENQCLIYINIDSYAYDIILLDADLNERIFLPFYEWVDNDLILLADSGNIFVHVNLLDNKAQIIQKNTIEKFQVSIYDDWNKLNKFLMYKVYPNRYHAVIKSKNVIMLMNYKNDTESVLKIVPIKFHDIEVATTNCAAQISESEISVMYGGKNVVLYPKDQYYRFLRGKFITIDKTDYLLLLLSSNFDSTNAKIEKYPLKEL